MPKYEVFIKPGKRTAEIEADNIEEEKETFAELVRDNLEADDIEANNLDTEDGEDPK